MRSRSDGLRRIDGDRARAYRGQKDTMIDGLITIPVAEWRRLQGIANAASFCLGYTDDLGGSTTESDLRDSIKVVRAKLEKAIYVGMEE